jgi:hypothetical protein
MRRVLRRAIDIIAEYPDVVIRRRHASESRLRADVLDWFAELSFELIFAASSVRNPDWTCWDVQHNAVWSPLFRTHYDVGKEKTWKIFQFNLRRLLFDEIHRMDEFANFKSARIIAICLNCAGFTLKRERGGIQYAEQALRISMLHWLETHFVKIWNANPDLGQACLVSSITYEPDNARLVKTYPKNLRNETPKEYFRLREGEAEKPT